MAILVGPDTRAICQGMTGRGGSFHTQRMLDYGTKIVAGVTPGKGGSRHLGLPVFSRAADAVSETGANASIIFAPAAQAAEAINEAIDAAIPLVVCATERIPVLDMMRVKERLANSKTVLIGPNSQGILSPGVCKLGVMSFADERRGRIGIVSRSATLTSEIVAQTSALGLGQSTTVGVGGDPVHGISFVDCLKLFMDDPETDGIILLGEIGGAEEERAAAYLGSHPSPKPVTALVVGRFAPTRRRMGHAGTLNVFGRNDANSKIEVLRSAGVAIAPNAHLVAATMQQALAQSVS